MYKSEESKVQTVEKIHALYRELAGLKEKMFITGSKFDKLAKVKGMCNDQLKKHDLGVLYQSCINMESKTMSFIDFASAMVKLYLK